MNRKKDDLKQQLDIINTITKIFNCIYYVDMRDYSFFELGVNLEGVQDVIGTEGNAKASFERMYTHFVDPDYVESVMEFTDLDTLNERLKDHEWISLQFFGPVGGWSEGIFVAADRDKSGNCKHVIWATRNIDASKRKEEFLETRSNTDELTQLKNRYAYEKAFDAYDEDGIPDDLVYVSLDVNGLKIVNDTLGHAAGDELLIGAAECMKQCLSPYGEVYRTGGDEFIALLSADRKTMEGLAEELAKTAEGWSGKLISSVSLSCGYVMREDYPKASMQDIAIMADKKMYVSKSEYYKTKGRDRSGMKDAHVALCYLYKKILKVNITADTYQVVNMDACEKTDEKSFFNWMKQLGESGQVHPDDLDYYFANTDPAYMRRFFKEGNTLMTLHYRRRSGDGYCMAYVEITLANDYSHENQNLFLYVKEYPID